MVGRRARRRRPGQAAASCSPASTWSRLARSRASSSPPAPGRSNTPRGDRSEPDRRRARHRGRDRAPGSARRGSRPAPNSRPQRQEPPVGNRDRHRRHAVVVRFAVRVAGGARAPSSAPSAQQVPPRGARVRGAVLIGERAWMWLYCFRQEVARSPAQFRGWGRPRGCWRAAQPAPAAVTSSLSPAGWHGRSPVAAGSVAQSSGSCIGDAPHAIDLKAHRITSGRSAPAAAGAPLVHPGRPRICP